MEYIFLKLSDLV